MLAGFMGSGKSTVGPLVARRRGVPFVDLDDMIEERAGRSISAIFEAEGEDGFRRREQAALWAVLGSDESVVAAPGGGALVHEGNLRRALRDSRVVYLRASAVELARRLEPQAVERPLLQDKDGQPLVGSRLTGRIETFLQERRPFYEQAHVTVDTTGQSVRETVEAIIDALHVRKEE